MKNIEIIGGGTVFHIRNHMALTAPAYGKTARDLAARIFNVNTYSKKDYQVNLTLTKMASQGESNIETNQDVSNWVDTIIANPATKIVFFNPALVDFEANVLDLDPNNNRDIDSPNTFVTDSGKYETRLKTSDGEQILRLVPSEKILAKIRKERKDIFLVAFKTTCGATEDEQFLAGLNLLKSASCNLVLANDTKTRKNMIITPEQARYSVTPNRNFVLRELIDMTLARAELHFTRSKVVEGNPVPWEAKEVPESLRTVVDHCIAKGAYKPFKGSTVGHFAVKMNEKTFLTSRRKTDFNKLPEVGLVKVESTGPNDVVAYGSKPSVGGMSQRIIFSEHPEMDCIVHFHCPLFAGVEVSTRAQKNLECGSHECGKNTSNGLKEVTPGIKCVYLDNHGPNIVFNRNIDPQLVIDFIDQHFDLHRSTDQVDRSKNRVV
jgi:hypothetical protein